MLFQPLMYKHLVIVNLFCDEGGGEKHSMLLGNSQTIIWNVCYFINIFRFILLYGIELDSRCL